MNEETVSLQARERRVRDEQAPDYEDVRRRAYFRWFGAIERRAIASALSASSSGWLLDAGCSTGRMTSVLEKLSGRLVSADFSLESLRLAGRRHPQSRFVQADVAALPFRGVFPALVCLDVLHCIPADKRVEALRAFRAALAEGGRIVATIWNRASFPKIFSLPPEGRFKSGIYYQSMSEEDASALFRRAGYREVHVAGLGHFLHFIRSHRRTATLYRLLGWATIPWELALTRRGSGSWRDKALYYLIMARK